MKDSDQPIIFETFQLSPLPDKSQVVTKWFYNKKIEIIMIVLLIVLFGVVLFFSKRQDPYLESVKPILFQILKKAGYHSNLSSFPIQLKSSNERTYTIDKKQIYVLLRKPSGERYNKDTLLFVILHEVAHILSPDEHHTKRFYQIEKKLHKVAMELGYIRKDRLDKSYPCQK
jgi:beta-lactamase regulating signal transducer with metallopeptidase domain